MNAIPYAVAAVAWAVLAYRFACLWLERVHPVVVPAADDSELRQEVELLEATIVKMQRQISACSMAVGMKIE